MRKYLYHIIWLSIKALYAINRQWGAKVALRLFITPLEQKVRDREKPFLKSYHSKQVEIESKTIQYYSFGDGTDTILLLHGWQGNAGSMGAFVNPLIDLGFKVITVDAPAHHKSQGNTCSIPNYARVIQYFIARHNPTSIIAHSFACAATAYALSKVDHSLRSVVLLAPPNKMSRLTEKFFKLMKLNEPERIAFSQELEKLTRLKLKEARVDIMLKDASFKTLILHDKNDRIAPFSNAIEIESTIPNAILIPTTGLGHYKILWDSMIVTHSANFIFQESFFSIRKRQNYVH